jgi:uncharacterized protein (TIRG00374 family)
MSTTAPRSAIPWHTLIILVLTIGLLWLFVQNIDFARAWEAVTHAHPGLIALAVLATFSTYVLRAFRWLALLEPLGRVRFSTAFRTTVIGFTAIFLLPGRVGEVLRPFLLARHEGLKATAVFATVVVERLLDVATVLLLFAIALPLSGVDVGPEARAAGVAAAVAAIVGLGVLAVSAGHPERLGRWAGQVTSRLPRRLAEPIARLVQSFVEGLVVLRSPAHLARAAAWSIVVWLSIGLGIWLTSHAFDLTLSFVGSFVVVGYLAVGVSLPTPGGAGGFHVMYKVALTSFFGADADAAAAAAVVLHAISFVPVSLFGLWFMWQDGLSLGRLRAMRAEAQAAEKL